MLRSRFDEIWFTLPVHDSSVTLCNRKMSTRINALAKAGFVIEQMFEETDKETMHAEYDLIQKQRKAKMMPLSFIIKAGKQQSST